MTAGQIAATFTTAEKAYSGAIPAPARERLNQASDQFAKLVKQRNYLMHARPITDPEGKQRLYRNWKDAQIIWTADQIDELCKACDGLARELNDLFYHWLP